MHKQTLRTKINSAFSQLIILRAQLKFSQFFLLFFCLMLKHNNNNIYIFSYMPTKLCAVYGCICILFIILIFTHKEFA